MRKMVSLGGTGWWHWDCSPNDFRQRYTNNAIVGTDTRWIKLWINWYELQENFPAAGNSWQEMWHHLSSLGRLRVLDDQISLANRNGIGVVLTVFHEYPTWANGGYGAPNPHRKPANRRFPDCKSNRPWGWFISYLCARYKRGAPVNDPGPRVDRGVDGHIGNPYGAWLNFIEFVNEPNYTHWPQSAAACNTVEMFRTADEAAAYWVGQHSFTAQSPGLLGPATTDREPTPGSWDGDARSVVIADNERDYTPYHQFVQDVLSLLRGYAPRHSVGWSHHNYIDILNPTNFRDGRFPDLAEVDRRRFDHVMSKMSEHGWGGMPLGIFLTEGGLKMPAPATGDADGWWEDQQVHRLYRNFHAMKRAGGAWMWTQHTINDAAGTAYRYAIRRNAPQCGQGSDRPAYSYWQNLPGMTPAW
jgi:hypothetical protein